MTSPITLSDAIKEAYENAPADTVYYDTFEIDCSAFSESIKVVISNEPLTVTEGTFLPVPTIGFELPETVSGSRGQLVMQVPGIPRAARKMAREAARARETITIKYRQYLGGESDPDAELPVLLTVSGVDENYGALEITAMLPDLVGMYFPRRLMTFCSLYGCYNLEPLSPAISAGWYHTVGLKSDGTCLSVGRDWEDECKVTEWTDIVAIAAGFYSTIGVKSDGTCIAAGDNGEGQGNVTEWTGIVQVDNAREFTVGLKSDGTCVATGVNNDGQCDVTEWTGITQIACGEYHTVGLKSDGTCVATGDNSYDQCEITGWTDISYVACGWYNTVGVKSDGTCVYTGTNYYGEGSVTEWTSIADVACGEWFTIGRKTDGTCVATGDNFDGACDVTEWSGIAQIACGQRHTVGLQYGGSCVAVGYDDPNGDQLDVGEWAL